MIAKEDLKKMDASALKIEAESLRKELFNLKLGLLTGQVKDTSQFKKIRCQIARILTLAQKEQQHHGNAKKN
ncbi:MAG: 50S ribosomal protein L29 [Candidatus Babeliales bacterium]|jgi:ribosomal protein L29